MNNNINNEIEEIILQKTNSKKRVNSYKKGSNFERKIAHILSEKLNMQLIRTPMSGGFSTIHQTRFGGGDLFPADEKDFFPFVIECKHYKDLNILSTLKEKSIVFDWIEENQKYNYENKKIPLIFFKLNYSDIYIIVKEKINYYNNLIDIRKFINTNKIISFSYNNEVFLITLLENLNLKSLYDYIKKLLIV